MSTLIRDHQVAPTATVEVGHALALQPEQLADLGPARDDELLDAVEGLEVEVGTERRLGHRDRQILDQVVALAVEAVVRLDPQPHVQVAGRAATGHAHRTPTGQTQGGAVVHARRARRR